MHPAAKSTVKCFRVPMYSGLPCITEKIPEDPGQEQQLRHADTISDVAQYRRDRQRIDMMPQLNSKLRNPSRYTRNTSR